jgi:hypothetical protein
MAPEAATKRAVRQSRTRLVQPALPLSFSHRIPTPKVASPVIDPDASGGLEVNSEHAEATINELGHDSQFEALAIEDERLPQLEQTVGEYHEKEVIAEGQ